ncbi:hypothetical protein K502DRAFT_326190 [Neoconidiobolus thromboides FSU 785]|nr:hypothetical protein K502DRAFT_326190 [Neoconidiobolus thromboides FSU 785]
MSITPRSRVLKVYRELLSLTQEIPKDHLRPKRQFRDELKEHIVSKFKLNKEVPVGSEEWNILIKDAEEQLTAFENLADNKYHDEFPLSNKMLNPASNPKYYENLVLDLAKTDPNKKPTVKDYLKGFFRR